MCRVLVVIAVLLALCSSIVTAQDTPTPQPLDSGKLSLLATQVAENAERAARAADKSDSAVSLGFNMLNLFQSLGAVLTLIVPIVLVGAGFFGLRRLQSLNTRLDDALAKIDVQAQYVENLQNLARDILDAKRQAEKAAYRVEVVIEENQQALTRVRDDFGAIVQRFEDQAARQSQQIEQNAANQIGKATRANLAMSLLLLGERQYRSLDFSGALDTYNRALELDPDNLITHYRLGYVYTQSGDLEKAQHHLQTVLGAEPNFAPALAALGYVYRRIGEKIPTGIERDKMLNRAEKLLLDALSISPNLIDDDNESWWGSLGGLYRRRNQIDEAVYAYERAADVTPHSSYAYSNLALLYAQKHNEDAMLATYQRVEKLAWGEVLVSSENYWAYADLLTARLALGKIEEADEMLSSIFIVAPSESPYVFESLLDTLGRLAQALGPDEADDVKRVMKQIHEHMVMRHGSSPTPLEMLRQNR